MPDPKPTTPPDWWTPQELAARWRCHVSTIYRRMDLPATDAQHVKSMAAGGRKIHLTEILRHESPAKSIEPHRETIVKPSVPRLPDVLSAAEAKWKKRRESAHAV